MISINVWAADKLESDFWENTNEIDLAYQTYDFYKTTDSFTCMPTKILDAKLWMWDYWFAPHPYNNRFHDKLLSAEGDAEHWRVEFVNEKALHKVTKKRNGRFFAAGVFLGVVGGCVLTALVAVPVVRMAKEN